jgi:hypothetical protein
MNEEYIKKADAWFKRGKKEKDAFIKFLLYYISFEILTKLKNLNRYYLNDSIKENFFKEIDLNIVRDLKNLLDKDPLKNMQYSSKPFIKLNNEKDFNNILKFINCGRNNLFHGDKSLSVERDIMIVSFGCKILESLIKSIEQL